MTADTFNPIVHVYEVRPIIPENLVILSLVVSEKKGGHEKTEIGHMSRPEVKIEKLKKPNLHHSITHQP